MTETRDASVDSRMRYLILGPFKPKALSHHEIREGITTFLSYSGITTTLLGQRRGTLPMHVRSPVESNAAAVSRDGRVQEWHRDGLADRYYDTLDPEIVPKTKWMIVWSNGTMTRIREMPVYRDGKANWHEYTFHPGTVLLFDNINLQHAIPPPEPDRWWVRILEPILPDKLKEVLGESA